MCQSISISSFGLAPKHTIDSKLDAGCDLMDRTELWDAEFRGGSRSVTGRFPPFSEHR
jgi:hypothetical protein